MSDKSSNTTEKQQGGCTGKGFVKGDPRINRKGRPKRFDELRDLAITIAGEPFVDKHGKPVQFPGIDRAVNKGEAILIQWAQSTDPRKQQLFIEYAYGKVPQKTELTGGDGAPVNFGINWIGGDDND